jgi:hypothetical protein
MDGLVMPMPPNLFFSKRDSFPQPESSPVAANAPFMN